MAVIVLQLKAGKDTKLIITDSEDELCINITEVTSVLFKRLYGITAVSNPVEKNPQTLGYTYLLSSWANRPDLISQCLAE